jgi:hypothetical protein
MSGSGDFAVRGLEVVGLAKVQGRFQGAARRLHDRLYDVMLSEAEEIAEMARARIGELFRNAGQMQAAVGVDTADTIDTGGALISFSVMASGLPYLAIHEYGGIIGHPGSDKFQAFAADRWAQFRAGSTSAADWVFTPHTNPHAIPMPERSYLRYALAQRREAIREAFAGAVSFSFAEAER